MGAQKLAAEREAAAVAETAGGRVSDLQMAAGGANLREAVVRRTVVLRAAATK